MDELIALLAALFGVPAKRERPASRLGQALRDAFAERAAPPPGARPPSVPGGAPRQPTSPPQGQQPQRQPSPPAGMQPASTPRQSVVIPPADAAGVVRRPVAPPTQPEAGRVTALFANPQSLVAAFVVAEVLAKPVALRDVPGLPGNFTTHA